MPRAASRTARNLFRATPVLFATLLAGVSASADLIGPDPAADVFLDTSYLGAADSPFAPLDFSSGYFYLEDWETSSSTAYFTTPGVSSSDGGPVSVVFGPLNHDSVDEDDGVADGNGLQGESWFSYSGAAGVTFTFDEPTLGHLPTHVGLVWTDGAGGSTVTFEAFDENGFSLGAISGGHPDFANTGQAAEDRRRGEAMHAHTGDPGQRQRGNEPAR